MTLTEFKREAQKKPLALELIWRYGKTEFEPWLRGVRRIAAVRSYGFDLELQTTEGLRDPEQKTSELYIKRAAQFELTGDILSVYDSGYRPATEAEQEALDGWTKKVEENPDVSYWAQQQFFRTFTRETGTPPGRGRGYVYLTRDRKPKLDPATGRELIFDRCVRGELALQYRVHAA